MNRRTPTVSVIVPCYNLGPYVDEAVQSVLDQTYEDFEIILIDDGSTDPATRNLFTSYARPKTRILRTENQGLARTRNLGIREATGRYVSCLDADDLLEARFLERTVAVLESEPAVAFASTWLTAFGEARFLWNPTTCDFPHLLAEDTVCCPALMRKEAVLAAGGYDPAMPVAGYEDWDLAIGLVERGLFGRIISEYLFRYRIRPGSMTQDCTAPANHVALMAYMVEKHGASYRKHLGGVLEVIERRTAEMENYRRDPQPPVDPEQTRRIAFLEKMLRGVLDSTTWKTSRPLRKAADRFRGSRRAKAPRISVVVTCQNQGAELSASIDSASRQMSPDDEIVIVDAGSTDVITAQVLDGYRSAGFPVLRVERGGLAGAHAEGLRHCRAPYVFAMGANETLAEGSLPRALEILDANPAVGFVVLGARDADRTGFTWIPETADLPGILGCSRHSFPVARRDALVSIGGDDESLPAPEHGNWDVAVRLAASGLAGALLREGAVNFHVRRRSPDDGEDAVARRVRPVFEKHRALFERHWRAAILGQESLRRGLQAFAWDPFNAVSTSVRPVPIDWGGLRRLEPVSRVWGTDRGQPIDRYYIERFLSRFRKDVSGHVLEVKDPTYTQTFGSGVDRSDVVDIAANNPTATIVADLAGPGALPAEAFDAFILTQTIHIIYDVRRVLENAARTLKPGGVLLATVPCVSRLDYESGLNGDFWRFTPASARRLFEAAFPGGEIEVEAFGNVLACCGFLMGLAADDLAPEELDRSDPYFPLVLCVRAVKAAEKPDRDTARLPVRGVATPNGRSVILLYHRIARSARDRWRLCVSPENFRAHLQVLTARFRPIPLGELARAAGRGSLPHGGVAVTFDDGYRDNATEGLPALREASVPATFFISGDGVATNGSFWWEALDRSMHRMGIGEAEARELHARLMRAGPDERRRVLETLPAVESELPPRMTVAEVAELSREPLAEIAGHGWSHRVLAALPEADQRFEIGRNIRELARSTGTSIQSFAYPFGGPFDATTLVILKEEGISVGCALGPEPVTSHSDPFALPRLEVGNWSAEELDRRLSVLIDG